MVAAKTITPAKKPVLPDRQAEMSKMGAAMTQANKPRKALIVLAISSRVYNEPSLDGKIESGNQELRNHAETKLTEEVTSDM